MANKGQAYGDLAERQAKLAAKYDPALEKDLTSWIEKETGTKLEGTFQSWLKSGVVLCKLMNKLSPDSCKNVHTGEMSFKQMENIGKFLTACPAYGVASEYLFQTPDLYEDKNMTGVLVTLDNVRRIQGIKAKGGKVEAVTVKESPMLRKGATKAEDFKMGRPEDPRKNMPDLYDRSNKEVVNAVGGGKEGAFGDLAERLAVIDLKYDKNLESAIRVWIEHETKEKIGDDFQAGLKSGVILCKLMNKLSPNSVPSINQGNLAFKQMENINNFLQAAGAYGVKAEDLFQTVALYEGSNMTQVLLTLSNLKRVASSK